MIQLIKLLPDGGYEINMIEAGTHPAFIKIAKRVKGSVGDSDGRKKILNTKEMAFVVHYSERFSKDSSFSVLTKEERFAEIKAHLRMPDNWSIDEVVKEAILYYIKVQETRDPTVCILNSLERGLMASSEGIESINETIRGATKAVRELRAKQANEGLTGEEVELLEKYIDVLGKNVNSVMSMSKNLPAAIAEIDNLTIKVREDMVGFRRAKGGRSLRNREIPTNKR